MKAFALAMLSASLITGSCGKSSDDPTKAQDATTASAAAPALALDGVDTSSLTAREQKEWSGYVGEFLSPCTSVPVSIAQCVKDKRDCDKCVPAAKYVMKGVKDGMSREQVEKSFKNRFDADKVKNVPIDGSYVKGPESAPITIVEFADFQCPHCGEYAPLLDKVLDAHKNDVRFAYKMYVLGHFPNSENAAKAAFAGGKQGKFWEMHHLIYANQSHLDQAGLDEMAKQLGLDLGRLHADMQSPDATERLARDHKLGEDVKIEGTPTIFVNGRQYDGHQDLNEWIALELQLTGGKAPPAPAPTAGSDAGVSDGGKKAPASGAGANGKK